jgi:type I restriction enzyme S subunit
MTDTTNIPTDLSNLSSPQISEVISSTIFKGTVRLDASFYGNYNNIMKSVNNAPLHEFCERIFNPPVFKREFQETENSGCRYLASSEIISLDPDEAFIHDIQAKMLDLKVHKDWILITGFGTIGSIRMVDNIIDGYAVANNVARIIPKNPGEMSGFIAAFLSCPVGKSLLNDHASGSVVRYIEAPTISNIHIPVINEVLMKQINANYWQAVSLREEVFDLLNQSGKLLHQFAGLPLLRDCEAIWFDPERNIESVLISSSEVLHNNHSGSEYRLDAHFYNPLAQLAIRNIGQSKSAVKTIDDVTERVFMCNRFKRNYVDEKYGVPFLSGKNIIQIRPTDLKHISLSETTDLDDLKLEAEWTLITRSGTIGRTSFIMGNYEGWSATEDIVRAVPNKEEIDPGYLYAFLSSPYGKQQVLRFSHGSVIDHITPEQVKKVLIPLPSETEQKMIGDLVRTAYEKRTEAIRLEDETQKILMDALT